MVDAVAKRKKPIAPRIYGLFWSIIRAILIIGLCFIILHPIINKISYSFMSEIDIYDKSVNLIPRHPTFSNIRDAIEIMNYWKTVLISVGFSGSNALLQTMACTFVGYGFARYNFKFKNLFFIFVIITMVIPPQTILISLYVNFRSMHLLNSIIPFLLLSLTATGLKNGLYIFLMRQFFKGMPKELDDAALVDGCGSMRTFVSIMLPNATTMMATIFLFSFVWEWSDSFYTGILWEDLSVMPHVLRLLEATASQTSNAAIGTSTLIYRQLINNTGALLAVFPLLILFIFGQRLFVAGIERSGIVG